MKNNTMSKTELIEKIKTDKVVKTEKFMYKAERTEQVSSWGGERYEMDYHIYRRPIGSTAEEDNDWSLVYHERFEDYFMFSEDI